MRNQNLFNTLQNVCNFTALESDMDEIINAIKKDNQMKTTNVPTEWFNELKRLTELAYINEDVASLRLAEINGQIKAHINCLKYFNHPEQSNSIPLTPCEESLRLLRDLADLQNGAPLEQHRQEWEQTMDKVYEFLHQWENPKSNDVDLEEFAKWILSNYEYANQSNLYLHNVKGGLRTFSEVLEAFKQSKK